MYCSVGTYPASDREAHDLQDQVPQCEAEFDVAEYLTALPPRGVLVERLHQATQRAQSQIEQRGNRETGHDKNSDD